MKTTITETKPTVKAEVQDDILGTLISEFEEPNTSIEDAVKSIVEFCAINLLENNLIDDARNSYDKYEFEDYITCQLDGIEDEDFRNITEELVLNNWSSFERKGFHADKAEELADEFMRGFRRGSSNANMFHGEEFDIKGIARKILESDLISDVRDDHFDDIKTSITEKFYADLYSELTNDHEELSRIAVVCMKHHGDEMIDKYVGSLIEKYVDDYICDSFD